RRRLHRPPPGPAPLLRDEEAQETEAAEVREGGPGTERPPDGGAEQLQLVGVDHQGAAKSCSAFSRMIRVLVAPSSGSRSFSKSAGSARPSAWGQSDPITIE